MNVGIIGAGAPSMAGLLATMALSGQSTTQSINGRGFRFVYRNRGDDEFISRIYNEDTVSTRADFLHLLREKEYNYSEHCALSFARFVDTEQIFKEFI